MAYYTEAHFRNYRENLNENQRNFSAKARNDLNTIFDIFISYNFNDKTIIRGVYNELSLHFKGIIPYINAFIPYFIKFLSHNYLKGFFIKKNLGILKIL